MGKQPSQQPKPWRRQLQKLRASHSRLTRHFVPAIRTGAKTLAVITFIASVVCLTTLTVRVGFDHSSSDMEVIWRIMRGCQWVFLLNIIYNLTLNTGETCRTSRPVKWVSDIAVLITLLPLIYPRPSTPGYR